MTIVGETGCKRRAVVEAIGFCMSGIAHRLFKNFVFVPKTELFFFQLGEVDIGFNRLECAGFLSCHDLESVSEKLVNL